MPSHLLRRVAWGLTWRWSLLFASLITPAPPAAIVVIAVLLAAGLVTLIWRRRDLAGSAWRVLLAVTVINAGFWVGGAALLPAMTIALLLTVADLWWIIAGRLLEEVPTGTGSPALATEPSEAAIYAMEPYRPIALPEPVAYATRQRTVEPVMEARRRRASRGTAAGLRLLVAACVLLLALSFGAFTVASRASDALSAAITSLTQQVAPITALAPVTSSPAQASPAAKPAATPSTSAPSPVIVPNGGGAQQPPGPKVDTPGLCISLPDGRYEVRLPNGQVIVVTTRHRAGCPDLSAILKALQNATEESD